jgi:hypothetical protein
MNALLAYIVRILAGITAEQWRWILSAVAVAGQNFSASDDKRGWVLTQLKAKFPNMSKSLANWVLESALLYLKAKGSQT